MKKKLIIILLSLMLLTVGCGIERVKIEETKQEQSSMFVKVESTHLWDVVYHKNTKVMYAVSRGEYNSGTFTLLVDAEGNPMIYGED